MEELRDPSPGVRFEVSVTQSGPEVDVEGELASDWESSDVFERSAFDMEFLGSGGEVLKRLALWRLDLVVIDGGPGTPDVFGHWADPVDFASFRVVRGSEVILEQSRPPEPLRVEMIEPSEGAVVGGAESFLEIVWRFCDDPLEGVGASVTADDDGFHYFFGRARVGGVGCIAEYSLDGGRTYAGIAPYRETHQFDAAPLYETRDGLHRLTTHWAMWPGFSEGADRARVRLSFTAGARWAQAESPVFVVRAPEPAPSPWVRVLEPRDGEVFGQGEVIELKAELSGFGVLGGRWRLEGSSPSDSGSRGAVDVTWRSEPLHTGTRLESILESGEIEARRPAMAPADGSPHNGVYTWRLDTGGLQLGHQRLSAIALHDGLTARDDVEIVVVAAEHAPTAVADDVQWRLQPVAGKPCALASYVSPGFPGTVHVLRNDIMGRHPLDPETLRIVKEPRAGSAKALIPPEALVYSIAWALGNAERAAEGLPEWTPQQTWDDELSNATTPRAVSKLYREHSLVDYAPQSCDGQQTVIDALTYEICDTQNACSQAEVRILIHPPQQWLD